MKYFIPAIILMKTQKCPHTFACLKTKNGHGNCEVQEAISGSILYLKCKNQDSLCPYRTSMGLAGQMCSCPTHYALFEQKKQQTEESLAHAAV